MPLQQTSGNVTADAYGGGGAAVEPNYIESVFSTFLYTGNGSTQTITNGIDLASKGGLVWQKNRSAAGYDHVLTDTTTSGTGALTNFLSSNTTNSFASNQANIIGSYNSNGFTLNSGSGYSNNNGVTAVSWTFRKQPKFFDVVTYTGTGANRTIAHNLGSVPGCIIVKRTDTAANWQVYHQSLANTEYMVLNSTAAKATGATRWNSTTPTSSVFSVGTDVTVNASGGTYVAYVFASNAGGFGMTGTDNVITCGNFTTDASGNASVNLGFEPQFWLYKPTIAARYWTIYDTMRGWSQTQIANLNPNVSDAEGGGATTAFYPTATGFDCVGGNLDASTQHIYIAIRRGPMKVPTDGTKVFSPVSTSSSSTPLTVTTNFPVDLSISRKSDSASGSYAIDRLRGSTTDVSNFLSVNTTANEQVTSGYGIGLASNTSIIDNGFYSTPSTKIYWNFRRAPSFFDEVCYTGTGSATTQAHNLGVVPEMMIIKERTANYSGNWRVYVASLGNSYGLVLNDTSVTFGPNTWLNNTTPTASVFSLSASSLANGSGSTYVNYLFATCAGVSKVGSYTGNGTTQTINCGFAGGARFVLIKRTDSTGDWYVYDTARGMTTLTDPYLRLNSTAAESATLGSVTTVTTGFAVNASILAAINTNGASYIFLAIA